MTNNQAFIIIKLLMLIIICMVFPGALPGIIIGYLLYVIVKQLKKDKTE